MSLICLAPTHGSNPCPIGRQRTAVVMARPPHFVPDTSGVLESKSEYLIYADSVSVKSPSRSFYKALKYRPVLSFWSHEARLRRLPHSLHRIDVSCSRRRGLSLPFGEHLRRAQI